jgi:hypothetical protein
VIALAHPRTEQRWLGAEHFEAATVVIGELRFAGDDMQRRAPFGAGFGERQRSVVEIEL